MSRTRPIRTLGLMVAFTVAAATPASAGTFSLSFSGPGISASDLDLTATSQGAGQYLVTSASGTVVIQGTDYSVSLIAPVAGLGNNDVLYYPPLGGTPPTQEYFDTSGLALLANGPGGSGAWIRVSWWPTVFAPWVTVSAWIVFTSSPSIPQESLTSISVSAVPEPSPAILLVIGLCGLALARALVRVPGTPLAARIARLAT